MRTLILSFNRSVIISISQDYQSFSLYTIQNYKNQSCNISNNKLHISFNKIAINKNLHFSLFLISCDVLLVCLIYKTYKQTNGKKSIDIQHHHRCEVYQLEPVIVAVHMIYTMHKRMHHVNNVHNVCLAQWQHVKLFVLVL